MTSKYAEAHQSPNGAGDARPTALQIVQDEGRKDALIGKTIFITGCSSGLGVATAQALLETGATLYLAARDLKKAESVLGDLVKSDRVKLLELDLGSLKSVRACAAEFLKSCKTLNILINNAGVMHTPEGQTADGFETQFGINYLGHFLLFQLLQPTLLASANPTFGSRAVFVSSSGHRISGIRFDDYNFEKSEYNGWAAYGQSKTAVIYAANEIERLYGAQNLHGLSLHPGSIISGLQKTVPQAMRDSWEQDSVKKVLKSHEQGAATTVWAAISKELEGRGALYLEDCAVAKQAPEGAQQRSPGYAAHAFDKGKEERLWQESLKMVGL